MANGKKDNRSEGQGKNSVLPADDTASKALKELNDDVMINGIHEPFLQGGLAVADDVTVLESELEAKIEQTLNGQKRLQDVYQNGSTIDIVAEEIQQMYPKDFIEKGEDVLSDEQRNAHFEGKVEHVWQHYQRKTFNDVVHNNAKTDICDVTNIQLLRNTKGQLMMSALVDGVTVTHEISQKEYNKFLAVDDYQRMRLFAKVFPEVDMKTRPGMGTNVGAAILSAIVKEKQYNEQGSPSQMTRDNTETTDMKMSSAVRCAKLWSTNRYGEAEQNWYDIGVDGQGNYEVTACSHLHR